MRILPHFLSLCTALLLLSGCASRSVRTADDITDGNCTNVKLNYMYGVYDIEIQTTKLTKQIFDNWFDETGYILEDGGRPKVIITDIDNYTDQYLSGEMIRDIFESVAQKDGRFTMVVGNTENENEMDAMMAKLHNDPKYSSRHKVEKGFATAPQFMAKVKLTKASSPMPRYTIEDYRMTVTLYDLETQELVASDSDVLRKKVRY